MVMRSACTYCNAPYGFVLAGGMVPVCGTIQGRPRGEEERSASCVYIEQLRRVAEDLDTAVMGISNGLLLGGTHMSPPLEFGANARRDYEKFGEFDLPSLRDEEMV